MFSTRTGKKASHQVRMKTVLKCTKLASGTMLFVVARKVISRFVCCCFFKTNSAFICEAPIIQGYDENGVAIPSKPIYPDGPVGPEPEPEKNGIAGEVIGIIVGVCVGIVFIMYGMFALGKKQGVELGVAAGTVNALGSTIDKAGNSISECIET